MLLTSGAGQGARDCVTILVAAGIPQGCQGVRDALACNNGAENAWSGGPCHIAERLRYLHMHRHEGLLHRQGMGGTMLHKLGTMASEGAQGHAVRVGPQRGFSPPRARPGVQPLTV
jgi:hypothetical protein